MTHTVRIVIDWPGLDEEAAYELASSAARDLAAKHPTAHMATYITAADDTPSTPTREISMAEIHPLNAHAPYIRAVADALEAAGMLTEWLRRIA